MNKTRPIGKSNRSNDVIRRNQLAVALSIVLGSGIVHAGTITVTNGGCELSDAILAANLNQAVGNCEAGSGADTIELPANSVLSFTEPDGVNQSNALPEITEALTINGHASIIERSPTAQTHFRLFSTDSSDRKTSAFKLTLNDLTLRNGSLQTNSNSTPDDLCGGAIKVGTQRVVKLNQSVVTGNQAVTGGGICGAVELVNSTVSFNSASSTGGGIHSYRKNISVVASTITNNSSQSDGGGVFGFASRFTISDSTISGNSATNGAGFSAFHPNDKGSVRNNIPCYSTIIYRSTVSNNVANGDGGGINQSCRMDLLESTVADNRANNGAGILIHPYTNIRVMSSTISGNSANADGGGISGLVKLKNSTISGNTARRGGGIMWGPQVLDNVTIINNRAKEGGGIFVSPQYFGYSSLVGPFSFSASVKNSVISGNTGTDCLLDQTIQFPLYAPNNVIRNIDPNLNNWFGDTSCDGLASGDAMLAGLADNGGPTFTHALLPASPLSNAGDTSVCLDSAFNRDQRGAPRLDDQLCDIGAYENAPLQTPPQDQPLIFAGSIAINHLRSRIPFPEPDAFQQQPIIILGPLSFNGSQPAITRIHQIETSGFDVKIQEYNYLDGKHVIETIDYLAIQLGVYQFTDPFSGTNIIIEAGSFEVNSFAWHQQSFVADFPQPPVVFTTVETYRGKDAVVERVRNLTANGFETRLFEEEKLHPGGHILEKVGFVAFHVPKGSAQILVNRQIARLITKSASIDHTWSFAPTVGQLKVEEERSRDSELFHLKEIVKILKIDSFLFAEDNSSRGLDTSSLRKRDHNGI